MLSPPSSPDFIILSHKQLCLLSLSLLLPIDNSFSQLLEPSPLAIDTL
ncbi:unnamed protein product [Tuber melanosporum]|uniref:(Perigord truffle) hypothetical protein n=1 Tax=Tuber melanosporum (strain Mel28) TaxID=656061 RepID=D5GEZ8_TUBMM|nr:uncharacterized protein GSTUM_00006675001 [Tuber melanosporum]CAZ83091.1 unnamed protein product [Tuber melanosporum]